MSPTSCGDCQYSLVACIAGAPADYALDGYPVLVVVAAHISQF